MNGISIARRVGLGAIALIAPLTMAGAALAQLDEAQGRDVAYYHGQHMMWGGDQWGGFGMALGPVFMILILVGIVLGVVYLMRHFGGFGLATGASQSEHRALSVLKERYAKGEIDSTEFDERKARLVD